MGNVFKRVIKWSDKLKDIQILVDKQPHNSLLKIEEVEVLEEYNKAVNDEEKYLAPQAKIEWLSEGDKNTKIFHTTLKERMHRSRIEAICNEDGERFEGENVP